MNNSYMEKLRNEFPQRELPLTEKQILSIEAAFSQSAQTRFVPKSARTTELQKELDLIGKLLEKADTIAVGYDSNTERWARADLWKSLNIKYDKPMMKASKASMDGPDVFREFEKDGTWDMVKSCVASVYNSVYDYDKRLLDALNGMRNTLRAAKKAILLEMDVEAKGLEGEELVENYLLRTCKCPIMSGVILPAANRVGSGAKTAETDLLIIAPQGIYVCEVKNYGKAGQTLEVQPNGEIFKLDQYGRFLENMGSPFAQNSHHCAAIARVLENAGISGVPIYSVTVISNKDVAIRNLSAYWCLDMYQLSNDVNNRQAEHMISNQELSQIMQMFQNQRLGERQFPIPTIVPVAGEMNNAMELLKQTVEKHVRWGFCTNDDINEWITKVKRTWLRKNWTLVFFDNCAYFLHRAAVMIYVACILIYIAYSAYAIISNTTGGYIHVGLAKASSGVFVLGASAGLSHLLFRRINGKHSLWRLVGGVLMILVFGCIFMIPAVLVAFDVLTIF